jgi:hypothetical protein
MLIRPIHPKKGQRGSVCGGKKVGFMIFKRFFTFLPSFAPKKEG